MDFYELKLQMETEMRSRKITKQLWDWKNNARKKCLVVLGARQIGKAITR